MSLASANFELRTASRAEPATVKSTAVAASLANRHVNELSPLMFRLYEEGSITEQELDQYVTVFISSTRCDIEASELWSQEIPVETPPPPIGDPP